MENYKFYSYCFFVVLSLGLMMGCSTPDRVVATVDRIVYVPVDVYVPMPCDVEVTCNFTGTGFEPTTRLLECVIEQKRAISYCRGEVLDKEDLAL